MVLAVFEGRARKPVPKLETYLKFGYVAMERECHLCPRCGSVLNAGPDYQPHYCSQCGQRVDFEGVEWKEERELGYAGRGDGCESVGD
jgi:hypothetical protein